jgi:hypothetical protein
MRHYERYARASRWLFGALAALWASACAEVVAPPVDKQTHVVTVNVTLDPNLFEPSPSGAKHFTALHEGFLAILLSDSPIPGAWQFSERPPTGTPMTIFGPLLAYPSKSVEVRFRRRLPAFMCAVSQSIPNRDHDQLANPAALSSTCASAELEDGRPDPDGGALPIVSVDILIDTLVDPRTISFPPNFGNEVQPR